MKYAIYKGEKTHARRVRSGALGNDLWFASYEVVACVGKYRQYWRYKADKPTLPSGYEPETEWHAAWKKAILDENSEVVCGLKREHRADIKTDKYVIEIQKCSIDGWAVVERNAFYLNLTKSRVIWIVNVEKPWIEKRIATTLVKGESDGRFILNWRRKWSWVYEIANTTDTLLYLDFNPLANKLIYMWTHKNVTYGKWISKEDFFSRYLKSVALPEYQSGSKSFLDVFKESEDSCE